MLYAIGKQPDSSRDRLSEKSSKKAQQIFPPQPQPQEKEMERKKNGRKSEKQKGE